MGANRLFGMAVLALTAVAWPGAAQAPRFAALSMLQPGAWLIRSPAKDIAPRRLCLGDARQLLQLRHPSAVCSRFVIADDLRATTVHYTCPGAGHARTEIRVESSRLAQIESQGIADNAPFDWVLEARWVGACPGTAAR